MTTYDTYGEKQLHTALNKTRAVISKIQSEQNRLNKKLESATKKEALIKQALIDRLTPNEETAEALKNPSVYGVFNSHEEFEKSLEEEESESKN